MNSNTDHYEDNTSKAIHLQLFKSVEVGHFRLEISSIPSSIYMLLYYIGKVQFKTSSITNSTPFGLTYEKCS